MIFKRDTTKCSKAWRPQRLLGLQFDDTETIRRRWASNEYEPPKLLRRPVSKANVVAVQGL
jgi:uncharacterized protein (DUF1330 family)